MFVQVNYRESITAPATFDYTHKKQSGGSGQYGKVIGRLEPLPEGSDVPMEFVNKLTGTDIPGGFVPSIEKGFEEAMNAGNLTGHPVEVRAPVCTLWFTCALLLNKQTGSNIPGGLVPPIALCHSGLLCSVD